MVHNYFCGNILAYTYQNLKLRVILELWVQIKDFTTFSNHFKPPNVLKFRINQKSYHVTKKQKFIFSYFHPKLRWPSNMFNKNYEKPLSNSSQ